jgi:abhydrolase domain-containing protein 12
MTHSEALFDAVVDGQNRKEFVRTNIKNFGTMEVFEEAGRKVILLKTLEGGHTMIGTLGGVQDVIRTSFDFTITS